MNHIHRGSSLRRRCSPSLIPTSRHSRLRLKSSEAVREAAEYLQLYPDPDCTELRKAIAKVQGVDPDEVICNNGSDETMYFAFLAYCDSGKPAVFPEITYGFYPVFADITGIKYREVPLKEDFSIDPEDYYDAEGTIFIANPNAPTGIPLSLEQIEGILQHNPDNVVVIDEAYVDFGTESGCTAGAEIRQPARRSDLLKVKIAGGHETRICDRK